MPASDPFGDLDALLRRCRKGDSRAWSNMVDRFQGMVYSIARRSGLGEEDAADVFQETFVALHRWLDKLESGHAIPKWLAVTASREAMRASRLRKRGPDSLEAADMPLDELLANEERSVEDAALEALEAENVYAALEKLGEPCRSLLTSLFAVEEPSYKDISANLSMPIGSIGPMRARCLDRLRRALAREGVLTGS